MELFNITEVPTTPHEGQLPGTSGLRKPVKIFQKPNYTENFVQSIFNYVGASLEHSILILGGDGRYFCKEAAEIIVKMSAANKIKKLIVGKNGILSTPAASHLIRKHKAVGGILLTASHNPGGIDKDFGIKYNLKNGGAAPTNVTNGIFEVTKSIQLYKIVPELDFDLSRESSYTWMINDCQFEVSIIDPVTDYIKLMKEIFDFQRLRNLIQGSSARPPFKVLIDCMHGVTGPYAKAIFEDELGAPCGSVINCIPLPDFNKGHPDPNLTHATELLQKMVQGTYDFGVAYDGDGDRNMILGEKGFFISASDSLAMLAAHIHCIPYFQMNGVKGFARSMPTSQAVDRVAEHMKVPLYEVPTGWKFFCNLLDADKISLCGEESFGTGSGHIREKDGIWASLAWLSIIEHLNKSVERIASDHWTFYGRNFYVRHDYENLPVKVAEDILTNILPFVEDNHLNLSWKVDGQNVSIVKFENFMYTDPIDKTTVKNQGIIVTLSDNSRVVFRLSGTGSTQATIRIYMERILQGGQWMYNKDTVILPLIHVYNDISHIKKKTGMDIPSVIT